MKKIIVLFAVLITLLFVVSCAPVAEKVIEAKIESESGGEANVDIGGGTVTVETEDATVEISGSGTDVEGWCEEGAEWKYAATTDDGSANAQWMIEGLMTSGQFEGLCHVTYTVTSPDGNVNMDYYFSEDGESGYYEMDVNGQKIVSEWHK